MLINCPRCNSVYVVKSEQVPENGKKFKCAECGKIWTVMPEDLFDDEPANKKIQTQKVRIASEVEDDDNVRKMFELLNRDTKGLFDNEPEQYSSNKRLNKLIRKIKVTFSPMMLNGLLILTVFVLSAFIAYFNRYEVVNMVPRMKYFYDKFGIECIYHGRDLKFDEVTTKYLSRKGKQYIEVHGVIYNNGKYKSGVPPIKVVTLGINNEPLAEMVKNPIIPTIDSHFSSLFRILIENSGIKAKSIELSFLSKEETGTENEEEKQYH